MRLPRHNIDLPFLTTILLFLIYTRITLSAKTPTSFCKCICAGNSTIIPLDSPGPAPGSNSGSGSSSPSRLSLRDLDLRLLPSRDDDDSSTSTSSSASSSVSPTSSAKPKKPKKRTCSTCNRSFCLSYNLPICTNVPEQEIFTTCFQRDSVKDQLVVLIFIGATAALLGWAAVRPWVEQFNNRGGKIGGAGSGGREGYEGIDGGEDDERRRGNDGES